MKNLSKKTKKKIRTIVIDKELAKTLSLTRLSKVGFFKLYELPSSEVEREVFLYRVVLDKALVDYFSNKEDIRKEVEEWLSLDNEDFISVCSLAMFNPKDVYITFKVIKKILRGENAKFKKFGVHTHKDGEDSVGVCYKE